MSGLTSDPQWPLSGWPLLEGLPLQAQFWLLRLSAYALVNLADDAALLALMFC